MRPDAPLAVVAAVAVLAVGVPAQQPAPVAPDLTNLAAFTERAPEMYTTLFDTSAGMFTVRVTRAWAPHGADRFYNLVKRGFYDDCRFFRVVPTFVAQFGIHGDPAVTAAWRDAALPPDRPRQSNTRGRVTFAMGRLADSRTTQVFINLGDNQRLDIDGFAPFGEVTSSMVLVDRIFSGYGEGADQGRIMDEGHAFLLKYLPRLDYIKSAEIAE
jgi:peptidyl-prolyl cis-trans isomerase A (cyclophilin A)